MKYLVQWKYKSSLAGPWLKGDVVEIDDWLAEAINRDSPGVLRAAGKKAQPLNEEARKDRMVREAETRGRGAEAAGGE